MAKHNETGRIGEDIAARYLERKGFQIVSKNFFKPYGEIDIVSREKSGKYHFVEVKTVSHETYRPEENMHPQKVRRLMRVVEVYLVSHGITDEWQFDLACVYLDQIKRTAKVKYLENIILGG